MNREGWDGEERRRSDAMELFGVKYSDALGLLSPHDLERAKEIAIRQTYEKDGAIVEPEHRHGGIFAVVAGAVALSEMVGEKHVQVCHRRRRGDLFLLKDPSVPTFKHVSAKAVRDGTVVYSVSWQALLTLDPRDERIAKAAMLAEAVILEEEIEFAVEQRRGDTRARVMNALYIFSLDAPDLIVRESRPELAQEAATTVEEVSRHLAKLRTLRLIEMERNKTPIGIPDPQRLLRTYRARLAT